MNGFLMFTGVISVLAIFLFGLWYVVTHVELKDDNGIGHPSNPKVKGDIVGNNSNENKEDK